MKLYSISPSHSVSLLSVMRQSADASRSSKKLSECGRQFIFVTKTRSIYGIISRKTLCPPRTIASAPDISAASAALCAISAPSMTVSPRVKTIFLRPLSGLPPGKSARVRRPTMTVLPRVSSTKCCLSAFRMTGYVPSAPMPQSE